MSPLLVALLGIFLVPLFLATWRASLFGLACQGLLMALIAYRRDPDLGSAEAWLTLVDLAVVRGLGAPLALYAVLKAQKVPARNDVIPPNLLSWTVALALVLMSFSFSELLVPEGQDQQTLVAVSASGVVLGFLVLTTQGGPFSQMIGALRIENAIALLELGAEGHVGGLGVHLGLVGVFVGTVYLFRWYLKTLGTAAPVPDGAAPAVEAPTL